MSLSSRYAPDGSPLRAPRRPGERPHFSPGPANMTTPPVHNRNVSSSLRSGVDPLAGLRRSIELLERMDVVEGGVYPETPRQSSTTYKGDGGGGYRDNNDSDDDDDGYGGYGGYDAAPMRGGAVEDGVYSDEEQASPAGQGGDERANSELLIAMLAAVGGTASSPQQKQQQQQQQQQQHDHHNHHQQQKQVQQPRPVYHPPQKRRVQPSQAEKQPMTVENPNSDDKNGTTRQQQEGFAEREHPAEKEVRRLRELLSFSDAHRGHTQAQLHSLHQKVADQQRVIETLTTNSIPSKQRPIGSAAATSRETARERENDAADRTWRANAMETQRERDRVEKENSALRDEIFSLQGNLKASERDRLAAEADLAVALTAHGQLAEEMEQEREKARSEAESFQREFRSRYDAVIEENRKIAAQNRRLESIIARRGDERDALSKRVRDAESENRVLSEALSRAETEVANLTSRCGSRDAECAALARGLTDLTSESTSEIDRLTARLTAAEADLSEMRGQRDTLSQKLRGQKESHEKGRRELGRQIELAAADLEAALGENDTLRSRIAALESEAGDRESRWSLEMRGQIEKMRGQSAEAEKRAEGLAYDLATERSLAARSAEAHAAEVAELRQVIRDLEAENRKSGAKNNSSSSSSSNDIDSNNNDAADGYKRKEDSHAVPRADPNRPADKSCAIDDTATSDDADDDDDKNDNSVVNTARRDARRLQLRVLELEESLEKSDEERTVLEREVQSLRGSLGEAEEELVALARTVRTLRRAARKN